MLKNQRIKDILIQVICILIVTISVLPGYKLIGNLVLQVLVTVLSGTVAVFLLDVLFKPKPIVFSRSLISMVVFWTVLAVAKQFIFHITHNDFSFKWYQLFYYDRPALICVVYFTCILYFIIKLLVKRKDAIYIDDYSGFIKMATSGFLFFYAVILLYSFFMIRTITFERPEVNLKPFSMMIFTFSQGYIDYELLFLFLGNIAIFLPLGILLSAFTKNKIFLITFPVILSFVIEFSQFLLGNGHPDVDDLILNVIGFYLGILIKKLIDTVVYKATKGELTSFFIFKK